MDIEITNEEIQRSIVSTYDSVNLINQLEALETLTQEDLDTIDRNKRHLEIMIAKDWFLEALTIGQIEEINSVIFDKN